MAKIDLLCKFQALETMIEKYGTSIDQLTTAFYQLDNICDEMESGQFWLGDAHDAYISMYANWKETFLRKLAGIIMFQTALNTVQESLRSALRARKGLAFDISSSNSISTIKSDDDSLNVLRVYYEIASSAEYEIGDSNPRFIDKIVNLLEGAKAELSGVSSSAYPEISDVRTNIDTYCADLATEKDRYTNFASAYYSFCTGVQMMESELCSAIDSLFMDFLAGMDSPQIEQLVMEYSYASLSDELSKLELEQADGAFLFQLGVLFNSGNLDDDALVALCNAYREEKASEELVDFVLKEGATGIRDTGIEEFLTKGIMDVLKKNPHLTYDKLKQSAAKVAKEIAKVSAKRGKLEATLTPYHTLDGSTHMRINILDGKINQKTVKLDGLKDDMAKVSAKWETRISVAFVVTGVIIEGFDSRVIDGMDWDDTLQNMADEAVVGVGAMVAGTVVTGALLFGAALGAPVLGVVAVPVGIVASIVAGGWLEYHKPLHGTFEEITDWWDMLTW